MTGRRCLEIALAAATISLAAALLFVTRFDPVTSVLVIALAVTALWAGAVVALP